MEARSVVRQRLGGPTRVGLRALRDYDQIGLVVSVAVVLLVFNGLSEFFLTVDNGLNLVQQASLWGIVAVAQTLVLVGRALDLSIGATMAFVGVMAGRLIESGHAWEVVLPLSILVGVGFGLVNGILYAVFGINPLIVTIGTQFLIRGLAYWLAEGRDIFIDSPEYNYLGNARVNFLPFIDNVPVAALTLVGTVAFFAVLMGVTKFGRHAYAIGGSPEASRLAGIPVTRRRIEIMMISGAFAALSGVVLAGYTSSGLAYSAQGIELQVIAAVILGGTSLMGGRGTVFGTLLGIVLIGAINNGIVIIGLATYWQQIVTGAILLVAVVGDEVRAKLRAR